MSSMMQFSLTEENRDWPKQIGCMNGIFQLFDRHHYLTGWRTSSPNNKRLLLGAQHQSDPQHATKAVSEKDLEVQKEKQRASKDSPRASHSSSCSTTFSSLDCNSMVQPESLPLRQINVRETKEQKPSLTKGLESLDLRDVVKDSMHREARGLPITFQPNGKRRGYVMKHIDSPRPIQQSKSRKPEITAAYAGQTQILARTQESTKTSKDERLALPRFSYDERASRETYKSTMKLKELPRLSLDSKASTMKGSFLESRLNYLRRDLKMENENSKVLPLNQETESHHRSSSIVAKLMGLDALPDTGVTGESRIINKKLCTKEALLPRPSTTTEKSKQNEATYSPHASQNNSASSSPRLHNAHSVKKPTTSSRFPMEQATWRHLVLDATQGSQKMSPRGSIATTITPNLSPSVYGEIQKRITEIEFKRSGNDLRVLKQILEAMQKTKDGVESHKGEFADLTSQRRCSLGDGISDQNSSLSMWQNRKNHHKVHSMTSVGSLKQSASSIATMRPAKVMDELKMSCSNEISSMEMQHLQRIQSQDSKYCRENSANRNKVKDLTPRNNNLKNSSKHLLSIGSTATRRIELEGTLKPPQHMKVKSHTTSQRSSGVRSPRLRQNLLKIEGQSNAATNSTALGRVKSHSSTKVVQKASQNNKHQVKSKYLELSDDQLSEVSSETRFSSYQGESNTRLASQIETDVMCLAHSINTNARHHKNSVSTLRDRVPVAESEVAGTMQEQPSPVSVLDATFYCEDSPSPVKKISTAFRDERPSHDEAEWHLEKLNQLVDCPRSDHDYCNQTLENVKRMVPELRLLNRESDETDVNKKETGYDSLNPDHGYINKILQTTGLLKGTSYIPAASQLFSSSYLINPDMFNLLEQSEVTTERLTGELVEKNGQKFNKKIERKIVFDMVNEVLVQKINSGRSLALGRKSISPEMLVKEVCLEVDHLCRMPDNNLNEEDDGLNRLLTADMMHKDWAEYSTEVPALVLDIERQIYKDLVNEVVASELMNIQDWPKKNCRQLYTY